MEWQVLQLQLEGGSRANRMSTPKALQQLARERQLRQKITVLALMEARAPSPAPKSCVLASPLPRSAP